jgi:hypothetical protein
MRRFVEPSTFYSIDFDVWCHLDPRSPVLLYTHYLTLHVGYIVFVHIP